jgi:quaternary ammonium compound-resistance protein SugE
MNAWLSLFIAGALEIVFTSMMKLSNGFSLSKWYYLVGFLVAGGFSFYLLSQAMKDIPIGTAYAIWTGIGAAGTAVVGMVFFKDPVSLGKIFFLGLLVASIVGLKFVSPE